MKKKIVLITILGFFVFFQSLFSQTWDPAKRLTWSSTFASASSTAVDSSGTLHLIWYNQKGADFELYHRKSTNQGATWTPAKRLTWNSGYSFDPAIVVDSSDNIHVVWFDNTPGNWEIYYMKSTNSGVSWTTKRLTWTSGSSYHPAIAVDSSDFIYVVWSDFSPGNWEIYYKKSTDSGNSWTANKRLTWTSNGSENADIGIDSLDNIHVVWDESNSDRSFWEIYFKRSTNGGLSWSTKRLTWNPGFSSDPKIKIDTTNHIHIVWRDTTPGADEIYYKKSTNGGLSWSTKRLTWTIAVSYGQSITTDLSNYIYVVLYDATPGNKEIYFKKSMNGGATWTTKRLTWTSGDSYYPAVVVDMMNNVHVFWEDVTSGNNEIYYRRGKQ